MNPPLVESIKLQGKTMAGFLVYPRKVALMFADEERTLYEWFVSVDKVGWEIAIWESPIFGVQITTSVQNI